MAKFSLDIPDQYVGRVLDAFADEYGRDPDSDIPKDRFAKLKVIDFVLEVVQKSEARQISNAKLQQAATEQEQNDQDIKDNLVIT